MSDDLDLTASVHIHIEEDSAMEGTYSFIGFRFRLQREPPVPDTAVLARWSRLTRGITSLNTRREFARERANTLFRNWCATRTYMKENKHSWLFDASYITTDSHALTLLNIALLFYRQRYSASRYYSKVSTDYTTVPYIIVCEVLSHAAWDSFKQHVYEDANNYAVRNVTDTCVNVLQRATREVSNEYDREDAFVKAFRRRGLPWQTVRNWIVPLEKDAHFYVVDSFGNISGRDEICVD